MNELTFEITADDIIREQGGDPDVIRSQSPHLLRLAEQAVNEAKTLIHPMFAIEVLDVTALSHDRLILSNEKYLEGSFVLKHLVRAEKVAFVVCTISAELEQRVSKLSDLCYSLLLDAAGSVAVERLATSLCKQIEANATLSGLRVSLPLNPGMDGWLLENGQRQIFAVLRDKCDVVRLSDESVMEPAKSLSFVLGLGADINSSGTPCDLCGLRNSCERRC